MKPDALVFLTIILFVVILVLAALWLRFRRQQLQHQERMAALDKGVALIPAVETPAPWSPRTYLLRGLIWSFIGATLTIALLGTAAASHRPLQPASAEILATRAKRISQDLDVSVDQARDIVAKEEADRMARTDGPPAAIALWGLIPLGVGLAYLIYYRSFESRSA